ncbi:MULTISPECIES: helix-turn-helix domain-containing protein [unclassified Streptomyces]|uniref:ArsR/SmtB family transcription factor n=1 Tax=unclassified Streptomyces TaxID=2593676 RepID=UPI002DD9BDFB|nr:MULTISPECIES: helix-turn-helix domain-containing protein [unclassified Streptomyces]WSA94852.1 helix-turn-helix domain-containing protein [Streptomyces sp. NBC_01795]WSB79272.1 helix-turn-helix domain-containing protein [Streptomyces sp. NBC_01775]WSS12524.1 helix-turn-helix domain-containing protein [Streptomyces sp. NBC_01186]WSS41310.1 helix-turn-helix domain-containing protein [Streptomyces sp. NBC_01187]
MPTTTSVRELPHPTQAEIRLETVLHALADPVRLRIAHSLDACGEGEGKGAACSEVELPVSPSTATHHFRVLREAGVINQCYRGTAKISCLRRADLDALFPGLLDAVLQAAAHRLEG